MAFDSLLSLVNSPYAKMLTFNFIIKLYYIMHIHFALWKIYPLLPTIGKVIENSVQSPEVDRIDSNEEKLLSMWTLNVHLSLFLVCPSIVWIWMQFEMHITKHPYHMIRTMYNFNCQKMKKKRSIYTPIRPFILQMYLITNSNCDFCKITWDINKRERYDNNGNGNYY